MTEEEITASLEEGVDAGVIEQHEHQMVRNVFRLDDRPLTSLMVPRADIEWLDAANHAWPTACKQAGSGGARAGPFLVSGVPRLAGRCGGQDQRGALAGSWAHDTPGTIEDYVTTAVFVPETLSGMELLEQFRAKAGRMVLVVDEYGVVQGLLTPHDLLEAITGELQPGAQDRGLGGAARRRSWLLDGLMPVSELKARLDIDELPQEDRGRYNTLAGLLMAV